MCASIDAATLLRPGLLEGVSILIAGPASSPGDRADAPAVGDSLAQAVGSACAALGARVSAWKPDEACETPVDVLVVDGAGLFARADADARGARADQEAPRVALGACLDGAWEASRSVAQVAFIDAGRGGRIVYLAPACPAAGAEIAEHSDAARAGLENLSRTLSIEWARHGITLVTIAPGPQTSAGELAGLMAYLASPAGAYFSGCLLDLRGPRAASV
jgi:NAD(P)-dependent dehydrogenase (short-subunit alcohol dehydrogenase family)